MAYQGLCPLLVSHFLMTRVPSFDLFDKDIACSFYLVDVACPPPVPESRIRVYLALYLYVVISISFSSRHKILNLYLIFNKTLNLITV